MDQFEILLNLINFEFIIIVLHVGVVLLLLGLCLMRGIEEIIPIKVKIVFGQIFVEGNGLIFGNSEFMAD